MTRSTADLDTAAAVLAAVARGHRRGRRRRRPRMLQAAVAWAAMHSVDSLAEAATVWDRGDTGMPVAGPGAPLVAEFSVTEFAAAIGLPTEAGKAYLGEAVELRYRLPRVWSRVVNGRPARLAGPPDRPRDHRSCPRRPPRSWTARSRTSRTRSAPPSSTGWSRRRSAGSCPRRPNAAAAQAADGRSLHHRHQPGLLRRHQHRVRRARPRRRPRPRRRRRRRRRRR